MDPLVSVVMSVYNGEAFVGEAVRSILGQTYRNLEFVIVDDASSDNSLGIVKSLADERVRVIPNEVNLGLTKSLVKGVNESKGKYIARLDADDVAFPNRIEEQVRFMEANPKIGISGTWAVEMGSERVIELKKEAESLKAFLLLDNVMIHSGVILRKSTLDEYKMNYDPFFRYAQDYDLWARLSEVTEMGMIPSPLVEYRIDKNQISSRFGTAQRDFGDRVRIRLFEKLLRRKLTVDDEAMVKKAGAQSTSLAGVISFCGEALKKNAGYDEKILKEVLRKLFLKNYYQSRMNATGMAKIFSCSFLTLREKISLFRKWISR